MRAALRSVAPLVPSGGPLADAIAYYRDHLGFAVAWEGPSMAGLRRGGIVVNLVENANREWLENASFGVAVTGLEALYEEFRGAPGRVGALETKAWGRREFHMILPSGVCLQFHEEEPADAARRRGAEAPELLTDRLCLRRFRPEDFEAHAAICADPEVMRFIRAGAITRADAWWQRARYMGHGDVHGYGLWAVVERATERLVGHLGFLNAEGGHGFEMGWALARDAWGKGYAYEGTREALRVAFTDLGRDHVSCIIRPENERSIRLAEKLGGRLEGAIEENDTRLLVYGISRP